MAEKNKVRFGLENVHYAIHKEGKTFDTPKPIPGAVNLTLAAEGEESAFYADNIKYWSVYTNNGYTGELEVALLVSDFLKDVTGYVEGEKGELIETSEIKDVHFALMFEVKGDKQNIRHTIYNCTASRPSLEAATTNENAEPKTEKLSFTAMPFETAEGLKVIKSSLEDSTATNAEYKKYFSAVTAPKLKAGGLGA